MTTATATRPSPAEILAGIARGKARRRRLIAAVVISSSVPLGLVGWKLGRHVSAATYLTARGYSISWQFHPGDWRFGGATTAEVAPFAVGFLGAERSPGDVGYLTWLHRVDRLDLSRLDGPAFAELATLGELPDLVVLNLDQRHENQWLTHRAASPGDSMMPIIGKLRRLRELNLAGTKITDAGLAHVAALPELRVLDLAGTEITDAGLAPLANLKTLSYVGLRGTRVTPQGAARLKLALPETDVEHESQPSPR